MSTASGGRRAQAKSALTLTIAGALGKGLFFLANILIYKALSKSDAGLYGIAFAYGTTLAIVSEAGLRGYLIRDLARKREQVHSAGELFADVMTLRLLALIPLPFILLLILQTDAPGGIAVPAFLFLAYACSDSLATLLKAALRAWNHVTPDAISSLISRTFILVSLYAAHRWGRLELNLIGFIFVSSSVAEVLGLGLFLKLRTSLPLGFRINRSAMLAVFRASAPFAALTVFSILYLRAGTFAISHLAKSPAQAAADYTLAARIPEGVTFLPLAVVNALLPFLARCSNQRALIRAYFSVLVKILGVAGLVIGLIIALEPEFIILLLSNRSYLTATPVFILYGATIPLTFLQYALANQLLCMNSEKAVLRRAGLCLLLNLLLNLVLVPPYGALGAGCALFLTEATGFIFDVYLLRKRELWFGISTWALWFVTGLGLYGLHTVLSSSAQVLRVLIMAGAGALLLLVVAGSGYRQLPREHDT